jgi:hypothetical protein
MCWFAAPASAEKLAQSRKDLTQDSGNPNMRWPSGAILCLMARSFVAKKRWWQLWAMI